MKKQTEVLTLNNNLNLLISEGWIIAVVEMQQGIINVLYNYTIENYELPENYRHFTVQHLIHKALVLQGFQNT